MNLPDTPSDTHSLDEEYEMPSVDALLAGTLALMTGYAQAGVNDRHRPLLARKLVSNLFFLSEHPQVSPPMRCMLANLRTRWRQVVEPSPLWHGAHEVVQ